MTPAGWASLSRESEVGEADEARTRWGRAAKVAGPALVFLSTVLVLLGPSLVGQRVVLPHDLMLSRAPWRMMLPEGSGVANPILSDVIDSAYPTQHVIWTRLLSGGNPMWLEDIGPGVPGLLQLNYGALSVFLILAAVLPFEVAWSWGAALRLLVAMCGAYTLTRSFGASRTAGTIAGLAYGLSGFMVGWLGWPQSHVAAFAPWVWWATRIVALRSAPWWGAALLALFTCALWLGGFPIVAAYTLFGAAIVGLHAVHRRPGAEVVGGLTRAALGVVGGTGLAAVSLVPTLLYLAEVDLGYRTQLWQAASPPRALALFVVPDLFGDVVNSPSFLGMAYVEHIAFVGVVTLALALAAWLLFPRARGVLLFTGLALGYAGAVFAVPPIPQVVRHIPFVGSSPPTRALALLGLSLAVLGGLGSDAVRRWVRSDLQVDRVRLRWGCGALAVGFLALVLTNPVRRLREQAAAVLGPPHVEAAMRSSLRALLVTIAFLVLAAVVVSTARAAGRRGRPVWAGRITGLGLVAVVAIDLLRFAGGWNVQVPRESLFPDFDGLVELREASTGFRVIGSDRVLFPNTHLVYGFADVRARALTSTRQREVLERMGVEWLSPTTWDVTAADSARWEPWLSLMGVKQVMTPAWVPGVPRVWAWDLSHSGPVGPMTAGRIAVTERTSDRSLTVEGVMVLAGTYGDRPIDGDISVRVQIEGGISSESRRPASEFRDNQWGVVPFEPIQVDRGDTIRIEVEGTSVRLDRSMVVWGHPLERPESIGEPGLALVGAGGYEAQDLTGVRLFENPAALPRVFAASRVIGSAPDEVLDLLAESDPGELHSSVYLDASALAGSSLPDGGQVEVLNWDMTGGRVRAEVVSERGAALVVQQEHLPGWHATVGGAPAAIITANHLYMAVLLPPGEHEVVLTYTPPGLVIGAGAAAASLCLLVAHAFTRRRRQQRQVPERVLTTTATPDLH